MKNVIVGVVLLVLLSSFVIAAVAQSETYQLPDDTKPVDPLKLVWQAIRTLQTQVTTLIQDVLGLKSRATSCEARLAELEAYTYTCANGATRNCGTDVGACEFGTESCVNHVWSGTCVGGITPVPEECDGMDEDCDSIIDDGIPDLECGYNDIGQCVLGHKECTAGVWGECTGAVNPVPETCNGLDDDCDGAVDNGLGTTTCGLGICENTVNNCVEGMPQTCTPFPAELEVCDGLDNDCDGQTDEGCDVDNDNYCTATKITVGNPAVCPYGGGDCNDNNAAIHPGATEVCNGIDDDCNGQTDEGCYRANGEPCTLSTQCSSGHCQNGFCCNSGDCCNAAISCPSGYGHGSICDSSLTCQGHASQKTCTYYQCGSSNVDDDSACTMLSKDCQYGFADKHCDGSVEQTEPQCQYICYSDVDCELDYQCNWGMGVCVPKFPNGAACSWNENCLSGFCNQKAHVCCNSDCVGLCRQCSTGLCGFVPAGTDPYDDCPDPMVCDGSGQCI